MGLRLQRPPGRGLRRLHAQGDRRKVLVPRALKTKLPFREAAALGAASLLILACSPAQYFGRQHDDVLYYLAAQALSERSYRLFTTPGAPPLTFVLPGFPLLLQPVVWLFGERAGGYEAFCALILAACPWLVRAWLARRFDGRTATAAACAFAASPLVLSQSGTVMPEAAYLAVFCALMLFERPRASGPLLLALTWLRPAGLSAVPALLAGPALRRRWAAAAWIAAWPAAGALAWAAWCRARGSGAQEVFEWKTTFSGAAGPLALLYANAKFYLATLGGTVLPPLLADGSVALAAGAALAAIAGMGLFIAMRKDRASPEGWAILGAGAMHLAWGWQYERYFLPLIPLGLWAAAHALGRRAWRAFIGLAAIQLAFHGAAALRAPSYAKPELARAYEWLSSHTRPQDALASLLYARDGYYAGRPSLPVPTGATSAELSEKLKRGGARYVLWQEGVDLGFTNAPSSVLGGKIAAVGSQLQDARAFQLVFDDKNEAARVYRVR